MAVSKIAPRQGDRSTARGRREGHRVRLQFTEPTTPRQDLALYAAVARAKNVVLATTSVSGPGQTDVLGGNANLARAHAVPGCGEYAQRPQRSHPLVLSLVVGSTELRGSGDRSRGANGLAFAFRSRNRTDRLSWPAGDHSDRFILGRARRHRPRQGLRGQDRRRRRDLSTLQDVHPTPTTTANQPMSGPEIQANAIWTALHGNPLQPGPAWLAVLALLLAGTVTPFAALRLRLLTATVAGAALAGAYASIAQTAFDSGTVLVVSYPLVAWALGTIGTVGAHYVAARVEQRALAVQLNDSYLDSSHVWWPPRNRETRTRASTSGESACSASVSLWPSDGNPVTQSSFATPARCTTSARSAFPTASCSSRAH